MQNLNKIICGVDEVGRGSLAGPVVAAAVILPNKHYIVGLNDSKKLSAKERIKLSIKIKRIAISIGIGSVGASIIDSVNIRNATIQAMEDAIKNLKKRPDLVLVDGLDKLEINLPTKNIIRGDSSEECIMAASIYAKVNRDKLMENYALQYPNFGFENNKGYGTKFHLNALKNHNPSPLHRLSFKPMKNKKSRIL
ncbi:ribonuclease HII [bacterium]|nr:ribonuclease HII [bacterium]MBT4927175.1 ribonuclease HII [bacterium]MBT5734338.1 ribonuclease HII [bacterium]MBT6019244.1 ribonuclease HII [bacterium]MBT6776576.1 ribonuclease HII [bacterium]